jgi:hypothetical protein
MFHMVTFLPQASQTDKKEAPTPPALVHVHGEYIFKKYRRGLRNGFQFAYEQLSVASMRFKQGTSTKCVFTGVQLKAHPTVN